MLRGMDPVADEARRGVAVRGCAGAVTHGDRGMTPQEREALRGRAKNTCANSRFLLGLIAHQTPGLDTDAKILMERVEGLDRDAAHCGPRALVKRTHSIQGQVAAIGLRSKHMMMGGP